MIAVAHATGPHLPLPLDEAVSVLALGALVFGLIAYDLYRRIRSNPGGDGWQ